MINLLKNLVFARKENDFCPKIAGSTALVVYAIFALVMVFVFSPIFQINLSRMFADLTQQLILQQINPIRKESGFLSLKVSNKLSQAAQLKAQDMAEKGYFSHLGPTGEKPWSWLDKVGYDYSAAGENLAINFSDPRDLIDAWMNSSTHAKNILNGYFTDVGIGIAKGKIEEGESVVVVMFLGREVPKESGIIVASAVPTEKRPIKDISPKEPIVTAKPTQSAGGEELPETAVTQESGPKIETDYSAPTKKQTLLINLMTYNMRFGFSIFLSLIIFWVLGSIVIRKERVSLRLFNSLFIVILIYFIWIPELL